MTARNEFELGADERIWEEVRDRLMRHPDLDVTDVEIEVEEAEVTLVGPLRRPPLFYPFHHEFRTAAFGL